MAVQFDNLTLEVDVITILKSGKITDMQIVLDETTAEATFDTMVEQLIKDEDLDSFGDITTSIDYAQKLTDVNNYLKSFDIIIDWEYRKSVNEYVNEEY